MLEIVSIEHYLGHLLTVPLIDVRSPGEYEKGHIPTSHNIPVFSNDERAVVGTAYKQHSKEKAMMLGLAFVEAKLNKFIKESEEIAPNRIVAIHCWRGGLRSSSFADHLLKNGFKKVYLIEKGYKAFRNHALAEFEKDCHLNVLGGYTGSGKTETLHYLERQDSFQVIDLEMLAKHKGSAFGGIGLHGQPTTEQFENDLFWQWKDLNILQDIWIEDESRSIGTVTLPASLFAKMREANVYFLDIPRSERAKFLISWYGSQNKDELKNAIFRISKRLGGLNAQKAIDHLKNDNFLEVAIIALHYYDKYYSKGLEKRNKNKVFKITLESSDPIKNATQIIEQIDGN